VSETIPVSLPHSGDAPPFCMSIRPLIEIPWAVMHMRETLVRLAASVAKQINDMPDVAASLKVPKVTGVSLMRQIDLRASASSPVVAEAFTRWNHERGKWQVMLQAPGERFFNREMVDENAN